MKKIPQWKETSIYGAKRANLNMSDWLPDWFIGTGKDDGCFLEGTWWDMVCLARNILSSENTKDACPEFYHPEMRIEHYTGDEPYIYANKSTVESGDN